LGWATGQFGFDFRRSAEYLFASYQNWPWARLAFYRAVIVWLFFSRQSGRDLMLTTHLDLLQNEVVPPQEAG
jgi:hypothetical protein